MDTIVDLISALGDLASGLGDYNAGTGTLTEALTYAGSALQAHQWGFVNVGDYLVGNPAINNGLPLIAGADMVVWPGL